MIDSSSLVDTHLIDDRAEHHSQQSKTSANKQVNHSVSLVRKYACMALMC